jgi:uncharacterized membrane protein YebE (DUF533 family)
MKTLDFDKLLLRTAFCCMASDGHIDSREIAIINDLCNKSSYFNEFNFIKEIQQLVIEINQNINTFISDYLSTLDDQHLTIEEELAIIKFAIETIKADDNIEYSEIKFFKVIRHHLEISNDMVLEHFPDIENLLEADIDKPEKPDLISSYLKSHKMPEFFQIDLSPYKEKP